VLAVSAAHGLAPRMLSRTVEDTGTVTSVAKRRITAAMSADSSRPT